MRSNGHLQRIMAGRQSGGKTGIAAGVVPEPGASLASDIRLFALTFAGGFLFTTIFFA